MRFALFTDVFIFGIFVFHFKTYGQDDLKSVSLKPKAGLQLAVKGEGGVNGSAVTWIEAFKNYYAVVAGNADYPLETYSENGEHLQTIYAGADLRGLWYNPEYHILEANMFDYHDIVSFEVNEDGLLYDEDPLEEVFELPVDEPQGVFCLNSSHKVYVWYSNAENELVFMNTESGEISGRLKLKLPAASDAMNHTTVVFTGIKGGEYGLLNYREKSVYLVDQLTCNVSATIELPKDAITHDGFRFSYANGHVWLFDAGKRVWTGYRILN